MQMRIEITIKQVYGEDKYYPANPAARMIADIAGTKTLTPQVVDTLQRHGAEIWLASRVGPYARVSIVRDSYGRWDFIQHGVTA